MYVSFRKINWLKKTDSENWERFERTAVLGVDAMPALNELDKATEFCFEKIADVVVFVRRLFSLFHTKRRSVCVRLLAHEHKSHS